MCSARLSHVLLPPIIAPISTCASVTALVVSYFLTSFTRFVAILSPEVSAASTISFPILHIITEGWLRSRTTIDSISFLYHVLKWFEYSLVCISFPLMREPSVPIFDCSHMSNASSITTNPIRSQASRNAGDGGLWLHLMALNPAFLMISIFRSSARSIAAAPSGPLSWWKQPPFSLMVFPFKVNPVRASKRMLLIPKV